MNQSYSQSSITQIKCFCILANSVKKGGHCIAGRELLLDPDNKRFKLQPWIRPVSTHGEGELNENEIKLKDAGRLKIGDIINAGFLEKELVPCQPENRVIDSGYKWFREGEVSLPKIECWAEKPRNLWLDQEDRTDRCSPVFISSQSDLQSLYLIQPLNFSIRVWSEYSQENGGPKAKRRAIFTYNNVKYDLPITDPEAENKYFPNIPRIGQDPLNITLKNKKILLCVSLGKEWCGYHYKMAACIIPVY